MEASLAVGQFVGHSHKLQGLEGLQTSNLKHQQHCTRSKDGVRGMLLAPSMQKY